MMSSEFEVLKAILDTSSKNDKLSILQDNIGLPDLAKMLDATFNYKRRFYIKKFDLPSALKVSKVKNEEFFDLLNLLEKRTITGHIAKNAVEELFSRCNIEQQVWYGKILRKDLKAGFSVDTAVKAGFDIPVFDVMLAKDGKKCKSLSKVMSSGVYASPKFDGFRCLSHIVDGEVTLYSRAGTIYDNFPQIEESLAKCFPNGEYVFDGEIMSDDFQAMQKSAFANKRGTTVGDVKYFIFGYVPAEEWVKLDFKMKTVDRLYELSKLSHNFDANLVLVEQHLVNKIDDVLALEIKWVSQGYEGAIALPSSIPYYLGKVTNKMMKFKTFISWDCEIVGFYEGKPDTKHEGRLGGLIVMQENGKLCRGAGELSDEDREYIWANQGEFLGRIAEFGYQKLSPEGVMIFPQFRRWRNITNSSGKI